MKIYPILIITALLSACAQNNTQLIQKVDPYSKEKQFSLGPIRTKNCPDSNGVDGWVRVNFLGVGDLNTFNINYEGSSWLFLNPQIPLDILIDGKSSTIKAIPSHDRKVISGGHVVESLYYPIDKKIAESLASANFVKFRALGQRGSLEQCLNKDELEKIKNIIPLLP